MTTGSVGGIVLDAQGGSVPGATILAVHEPSGTRYEAVTREDGRYQLPGMRVGGPYTVTASLSGFQSQSRKAVVVNLGVATDVNLTLSNAAITEEVTVTAESTEVFNSGRTGAATTVDRETLATLPTVSGRLNDVTRLTPQSGGHRRVVRRPGQSPQQHHGRRLVVQQLVRPRRTRRATARASRRSPLPRSKQVQVNIAPYDVR